LISNISDHNFSSQGDVKEEGWWYEHTVKLRHGGNGGAICGLSQPSIIRRGGSGQILTQLHEPYRQGGVIGFVGFVVLFRLYLLI